MPHIIENTDKLKIFCPVECQTYPLPLDSQINYCPGCGKSLRDDPCRDEWCQVKSREIVSLEPLEFEVWE